MSCDVTKAMRSVQPVIEPEDPIQRHENEEDLHGMYELDDGWSPRFPYVYLREEGGAVRQGLSLCIIRRREWGREGNGIVVTFAWRAFRRRFRFRRGFKPHFLWGK